MQATYNNFDGNLNGSPASVSVTHNVLPSHDTQFNNPIGPISTIIGNVGQCSQTYSVEALDVEHLTGAGAVKMEYSIDDNTFAAPTQVPLTTVNGTLWEVTTAITAGYPSIVYWRFSATDDALNQLSFGSYSFNFDVGIICP
jgi:hypothetical protein